jgi:hypothetical protein
VAQKVHPWKILVRFASETKDEMSVTIGNHDEPAGVYRFAFFSTTDVYYVVVTDRAKTKVVEANVVFCARPTQHWELDYEPDKGGVFGKTASGDLLKIPDIKLSELPNPEDVKELPKVTTNAVTVFGARMATLSGYITFAGTPEYTERGVVYSTTQNPTLADSKVVSAGTGTGSFSANVSGLTPNTTYYIRAYATNAKGTAYGEEMSFTTSKEEDLSIFTNAVTIFDRTTATLGGNIMLEYRHTPSVAWFMLPHKTRPLTITRR